MSYPPPTPRASAGRRGSRASLPTCDVCGKQFPQPPRGASMKTASCGIGCTVTIRRQGTGAWTTATKLADRSAGSGV